MIRVTRPFRVREADTSVFPVERNLEVLAGMDVVQRLSSECPSRFTRIAIPASKCILRGPCRAASIARGFGARPELNSKSGIPAIAWIEYQNLIIAVAIPLAPDPPIT
jgi:hypothetical protein